MSLTSGSRLGPYEIVSLIGAGGMGEVYKAHDTKLGRDVALKLLPESFAHDLDRVARFRREAQVLASLNHPHIAAIYGLDEANGSQFLVLELVEGETLAQRLKAGALQLDEALSVARQIAEALEAAHEKGVIHRDLKPANVAFTADGQVKVLDFGLAKAFDPVPSSSTELTNSPTLSMQATYAGVILGTAAYMSPEQASGKPVDKRADIWSFGVVLWEMLAGKPLFSGETISHTLADVLRAPIDLNAISKDTPRAVRHLLARCLDRDTKRRLRDIGEARIAIEEPARGPAEVDATITTPLAIPRTFWKRAIPMVAAAILAAGVTTGIAWRLWPAPSPVPPTARFSLALPEGQQFTRPPGRMISISPDGTRIVYVANERLWLRSIGDLEARPIAGDGASGVSLPVFSPDGLSIAFMSLADNTLKKVGVNGGVPITICPATPPYGMSWTTDGILFAQNPGGILRVSPNGGKPEVIVAVQDGEVAFGPQALNGGQVVLFTLAKGADPDRWDQAQIVAQWLASGERRVLINGGGDARYLPTGHLVYAVGGVLFAVRFDSTRLAAVGGATPIIEGIRRGPISGVAHFSVSATGSLVYLPGPAQPTSGQFTLALVDRTGQIVPLKLPPAAYSVPRLSPDDARVAFQADEGKGASIWIYDLSGATAPRRLTLGGVNRYPIWSADGRRVTFQSDREGDAGIFWQLADGTGPVERLTKPEAGTSHTPDSWSPSGDTLLFEVTKDARHALWAFSLRDKKSERLGRFEGSETIDAIFSPDGRWMAYDSPEAGGRSNVFMEPFPPTGARYQVTKEAGRNAFWSRDGQALKLVYATGLGLLEAVTVSTQPGVEFGTPVPMPRRPLLAGGAFAVRRNHDQVPDGKRIIGVVDAGTQTTTTAAPTIQVVLNWSEELKARVPTK